MLNELRQTGAIRFRCLPQNSMAILPRVIPAIRCSCAPEIAFVSPARPKEAIPLRSTIWNSNRSRFLCCDRIAAPQQQRSREENGGDVREASSLDYNRIVTITFSETVLSLLPSDDAEATVLVNEILEQALLIRSEPSAHRLENRPDIQADLDLARNQIRAGRTVPHEKVVDWNIRHR